MPFVPYKVDGLCTMIDAASQVGVDRFKFWSLVREKQLIVSPTTKVGRREYYDEKQMMVVMKQVAELRKKGVI